MCSWMKARSWNKFWVFHLWGPLVQPFEGVSMYNCTLSKQKNENWNKRNHFAWFPSWWSCSSLNREHEIGEFCQGVTVPPVSTYWGGWEGWSLSVARALVAQARDPLFDSWWLVVSVSLTWQSHSNKSLWFYSSFSGLTLYEQWNIMYGI